MTGVVMLMLLSMLWGGMVGYLWGRADGRDSERSRRLSENH